MSEKVLRKLFLGFISIHILHHAQKDPTYGLWMIEELKNHGYTISAGTLYPILNGMEKDGLLVSSEENVEGKIRKYYRTTSRGDIVLKEARAKVYELSKEIRD
ncbi:MAG: PadR family transcriptional regulator [Clostridia bacterium]|nr:PadR family transcriptional regulator [Clostridia bacterium]